MSAFIVSNDHISAIVSSYNFSELKYISEKYLGQFDLSTDEMRSLVGLILLKENVKSVSWRYKEINPDPSYSFKLTKKNPIEVIKLVQSLEYQSCEHETFEQSKAFRILKYTIQKEIEKILGYSEAKWTL